jgi:hypothetical protein
VNAWETEVATNIRLQLKRDQHLADCELAKAEPDATLACAECGRAQWMHETRHDTCGQFCWVTMNTITDKQIGQIATIDDLPADVRKACYYALNNFALGDGVIRDAKRTCASAINTAKRKTRKRANPKPTICQVEHPHWDGPMICGNNLPCKKHP